MSLDSHKTVFYRIIFLVKMISFPVFNDKLSISKESNALLNSVILYVCAYLILMNVIHIPPGTT